MNAVGRRLGDVDLTLRLRSIRLLRLAAFGCGATICTVSFADEHTFRFDPPAEVEPMRSIVVAGTFNGWSRDAQPMRDADGDGVYEATLDLPKGIHLYKFVVNGDRWFNDPASDRELEQPDGMGGINSAVYVGPDARKLPPARPNDIDWQAVAHDPSDPAQFSVGPRGLVRLGLQAKQGDVLDASALLGSVGGQQVSLDPVRRSFSLELLGGQTVVRDNSLMYVFALRDGSASVTLDANAAREGAPAGPKPFSAALRPEVDVPDWAVDAVWYQVFPERFRDGEPANNPPRAPKWTAEWYDTFEEIGEKPGPDNFYRNAGNVWNRRYGGDLQGVRQSLPYLKTLGINAIYFNPLFEASSLHKYDAADHRHIDDNFGIVESGEELRGAAEETDDPATWRWTKSDRLFLDFIDAAHAEGFKVVIDGVWNHTGVDHFAFKDVLKHGKNSRYADWFEITDWGSPDRWGKEPWYEHHGKAGGIQWKAWDGDNGGLPVFKKDPELGLARGPYEHVMAVTQRWTAPVVDGVKRTGVDGWRLDVPHDIPMTFWRPWRKLAKELNPDALLIGEVWGPADDWLQGDVFDGVMNYQFAMPTLDFLADDRTAIKPSEYADRLVEVYNRYPLAAALVQQNLIGSHDTDRMASMVANPDRNYDQGNKLNEGAVYSTAKPQAAQWAKVRQIVAAQYTFAGGPMTYYGDEVGMWGADDPDNRMPMVWEDLGSYENTEMVFDRDLFAWYQRLAAVRAKIEPLRIGYVRPVVADDANGVLVLARELEGQAAYVAFNRSDAERVVRVPVGEAVTDGTGFCDWLDPAHANVVVEEGQRPMATPIDAPLKSAGGHVEVKLPARGVAVITAMPFE